MESEYEEVVSLSKQVNCTIRPCAKRLTVHILLNASSALLLLHMAFTAVCCVCVCVLCLCCAMTMSVTHYIIVHSALLLLKTTSVSFLCPWSFCLRASECVNTLMFQTSRLK